MRESCCLRLPLLPSAKKGLQEVAVKHPQQPGVYFLHSCYQSHAYEHRALIVQADSKGERARGLEAVPLSTLRLMGCRTWNSVPSAVSASVTPYCVQTDSATVGNALCYDLQESGTGSHLSPVTSLPAMHSLRRTECELALRANT